MQTISTKYLPTTNTKGSRIKATSSSGVSITVSYDHALEGNDNHMAAAEMLKDKLEWSGKMVGGHTKDGMVFVFVNSAYII